MSVGGPSRWTGQSLYCGTVNATRLLLVEDDADLLLTTRLVLERQGFEVVTASASHAEPPVPALA